MNQSASKSSYDETAQPPLESVMLDCDHVLTHTGGDPELTQQLCLVFLEEVPLRAAVLDSALQSRKGVERAVQQLCNALVVFGAGSVSPTVASLEAALRQGNSRQLRSHWKRLQQEIMQLIPQVQRLMLEICNPRGAVQ
jgi:HPt (histidine-containing phosphotransfer) domain-containing protein